MKRTPSKVMALDPTPWLVIMRGLPGTGKSTHVAELVDGMRALGKPAVVASADHHFVGDDGVYRFVPSQIGEAHKQCLRVATEAMRAGAHLVVVDNTNTQKWEFEAYLKLAEELQYNVEVRVVPFTRFTVAELAERNVHGVPAESINRMWARWEDFEGEVAA